MYLYDFERRIKITIKYEISKLYLVMSKLRFELLPISLVNTVK